jgi:hypothetical protein
MTLEQGLPGGYGACPQTPGELLFIRMVDRCRSVDATSGQRSMC